MDYNEWIIRERKTRIKILMDSPLIRETEIYRSCQACGEICLCHEEACPNCNGNKIAGERIDKAEVLRGERIRCRFRFDNIP